MTAHEYINTESIDLINYDCQSIKPKLIGRIFVWVVSEWIEKRFHDSSFVGLIQPEMNSRFLFWKDVKGIVHSIYKIILRCVCAAVRRCYDEIIIFHFDKWISCQSISDTFIVQVLLLPPPPLVKYFREVGIGFDSYIKNKTPTSNQHQDFQFLNPTVGACAIRCFCFNQDSNM